MHVDEQESPRTVESNLDDESLATAATRDRQAFGLLYDRYSARAYGYCRRRLDTQEAAEDATSAVFMRARSAISAYRSSEAPFAAWLFAIAHYVVIDHARFQTRRRIVRWRPEADLEQGPEERAIATEAANDLRVLIGRLPPNQAEVVQLRLAGLNDQEISSALGCSDGAVRVARPARSGAYERS